MKKSYKHLIRFIKEFIKEGGSETFYVFQVQEFIQRIYDYYGISYSQFLHDYCEIKERAGKVYKKKIPKQRGE